MLKARKVDEYFFTQFPNENPPKNYLGKLFDNCTLDTSVTPNKMLFQNIYVPVRKVITVDGVKVLEDTATYYNVGLTSAEIAELYWTEYSGNYIIGRNEHISQDAALLEVRLKSILRKNLGKYLKEIELLGLEWNPLWNVDGTEIRQLLENNGTTDVERGQINSDLGVEYDDTWKSHEVSPYDSATMKVESIDKVNGKGTDVPTGLQRVTMANGEVSVTDATVSGGTISHAENYTHGTKESTKYNHNNAKNKVVVEGTATDEDYAVLAKDTAFGYDLTGGDKMHVEKLIRQGNIGVTKTTELIEDARKALRYSVIQEYFDDINEVILIGLYGNYI